MCFQKSTSTVRYKVSSTSKNNLSQQTSVIFGAYFENRAKSMHRLFSILYSKTRSKFYYYVATICEAECKYFTLFEFNMCSNVHRRMGMVYESLSALWIQFWEEIEILAWLYVINTAHTTHSFKNNKIQVISDLQIVLILTSVCRWLSSSPIRYNLWKRNYRPLPLTF